MKLIIFFYLLGLVCSQNNTNNINASLYNYRKIIDQIYYLEKFNLNEKNVLKSITSNLYNEKR